MNDTEKRQIFRDFIKIPVYYSEDEDLILLDVDSMQDEFNRKINDLMLKAYAHNKKQKVNA